MAKHNAKMHWSEEAKNADAPFALSGEALLALLRSRRGRAALDDLKRADLAESNTLALLSDLRRTFSPDEAAALLTQARLRRRAADKFPFADHLFLLPDALEQATAWPVALHHAEWIDRHASPGPVLDLGCGIGGDTLALAQKRSVFAIERDPLRLRLAEANALALGLAGRITFVQADWTELRVNGQLPVATAAFADPSRRVGERRIFHLHQIEPPIGELLQLVTQIPALGVKVMPGVHDEELPAECGVEFISHEGVCKEAVLWFGSLAPHGRWASVHTRDGWQSLVNGGQAVPLGPLQPGQILHEPDPAVIRSGALGVLCVRLDAWLFDPQIAYLVSSIWQADRLVQSFQIEEVHRFSLKRLNQRLQALQIGEVELKKRGFPSEPESLRPRLKLQPGGRRATLILTRRADERLMVIARRIRHGDSG
jgi:SAM-dependent methyltransferase